MAGDEQWKGVYDGPGGTAIIPRGTQMGSRRGPLNCETIGHAVCAESRERLRRAAKLKYGGQAGFDGIMSVCAQRAQISGREHVGKSGGFRNFQNNVCSITPGKDLAELADEVFCGWSLERRVALSIKEGSSEPPSLEAEGIGGS